MFDTPLAQHIDERGAFVELYKNEYGQVSFSTSKPGVTRGDHFHSRKHERFVVVSGYAIIRLRHIDSNVVHMYGVNGDNPTAIDIKPWHVHNITNVGESTMRLVIYCNEPYDPNDPDTINERVEI